MNGLMKTTLDILQSNLLKSLKEEFHIDINFMMNYNTPANTHKVVVCRVVNNKLLPVELHNIYGSVIGLLLYLLKDPIL